MYSGSTFRLRNASQLQMFGWALRCAFPARRRERKLLSGPLLALIMRRLDCGAREFESREVTVGSSDAARSA